MSLVVTRPQPQADEWVARLTSAGVSALPLPLLRIDPVIDAAAVEDAWRSLADRHGAMFVSPAAVHAWMRSKPAAMAWPGSMWAAAPGPGTAQALRSHGITDVLAPADDAAQFDSDSLWQAIAHRPWQGQRILIVHGGGGRERLAVRWRDAGAHVDTVQAYRRNVVVPDAAQRLQLQQVADDPSAFAWLFSSGEAAQSLPALLPRTDWARHRAYCTHPAIAVAARAMGFDDVEVVSPRIDDIAAALGRRR